jgi:hypothetical protein
MTELSQNEKLSLRLNQVLKEGGLHQIMVYVTPDKQISFWIVNNGKVEGLPQNSENVVNFPKQDGVTTV